MWGRPSDVRGVEGGRDREGMAGRGRERRFVLNPGEHRNRAGMREWREFKGRAGIGTRGEHLDTTLLQAP